MNVLLLLCEELYEDIIIVDGSVFFVVVIKVYLVISILRFIFYL